MNRSINEGYTGYQLKLNAAMNMLVSVYVDPEFPDDYIPGFVRAVSHRQVLLSTVSPYGQYDGYLAVRLAAILTVLSEDDVAKRLKMLLAIHGEHPPAPIPVQDEEDLIHALCREAKARNAVIMLMTANGDFVGFIDDLNDIRVTLNTLDYFGRPIETVSIVLRDVDLASLDGDEERMMKLLCDHQDIQG